MSAPHEPNPMDAARARLHAGFADEPRRRRVAMERWRATWAEAGIALAIPAQASPIDGGHTFLSKDHVFSTPEGKSLRGGTLVAIYDGAVPGYANQQLRHVHGSEGEFGPSPDSDTGVVQLSPSIVTLGPPLERMQWPKSMRRATAPTSLVVAPSKGGVSVSDPTGILAEFRADPESSPALARRIRATLADAASAGRIDAGTGTARRFEVAPGSTPEGRAWLVRDQAGSVLFAEPRTLMQRRPPQQVAALRDLASLAWSQGAAEARRDASVAAGPDRVDPGADDADGPAPAFR